MTIGTDDKISSFARNVRVERTKVGDGKTTLADDETDALMFLMLNELHANMPEVDRPMSLSDLSDEQLKRARNAVWAVKRTVIAELRDAALALRTRTASSREGL